MKTLRTFIDFKEIFMNRLRFPFATHPPVPRPIALAVRLALAGSLAAGAGWSADAGAETAAAAPDAATAGATRSYAIPAGPLSEVLTRFSAEAGIFVVGSSELARGKHSNGLRGAYGVHAALDTLLAGTGLSAQRNDKGQYVLRIGERPADAGVILPVVRVTASAERHPGESSKPFAGGQVARGGRLGMLGNVDFMDTPFNQSSYTAELMENQQAITIADVVANDPSVRTRTFGLTSAAGAGDSFMIRGFSTQNAVLFDGVAGVAPDRTFLVETAERIEVLKGPNALLNGMAPDGSVGGAINVVPKRAGDMPLTRFTASYESAKLASGHLDIGRRFGSDNQWGVRFNGVYANGDTATRGQSLELGMAAVSIDYLGRELRASLDAGHQSQDLRAPNGAGGFGVSGALAIPSAPDASRQFAQDWEFSKSKSDYWLAKAEYDLDPAWTLYGAAGGSRNRSEYLSTDVFVTDASGNADATVYYWPSFSNYRTAQGGLRGSFRTGAVRHQVNMNASLLERESGYTVDYYGFTAFTTNLYLPSFVPAPSLAGFSSRPPKTDAVQLPTVALSDTVSLLDGRIALTVGARHQRVKTRSFDSSTGVGTTSYDESTVTPMLAVVVRPDVRLSLYGNYIEGLGLGDTAPPGTTNAGQVFPPFKTKQYEVGVKYDFGRFAATASVFQIVKPSALTVSNGDGTSTYRLDGEQRNRGIEINVFGEARRGLKLLGGVAYTDARLTRTSGGSNDGNVAPSVPRWQLNLSGEYDLAAAQGLTLWARVMSTGSQYLDAANARSLPGWTRWDAGARYSTTAMGHPLVLRAGVQNLLDRNYWAAASGSWLKPGAPRTMTLSASVDF